MIALVGLNIGCSENLTTEKAQELIKAATKYPLKKIGSLAISPSPDQGVLITKEQMPDYIKLLANKLITMNIRSISGNGGEYYEVNLTEAGNRFVIRKRQSNAKLMIEVVLGELIFDKIISIRQEKASDSYKVNYLDEFSKITPFGTCLINKPTVEKTVRLVLCKGKWKIDSGPALAD